jgi:glycosyltransferase involved in cell wall biosynthesis
MHCTIVVPAFNTAPYIAECLHSCLAQTYQDYDVLVVDDGSTDSTPDIVNHHLRLSDKISSVQIKHQGVQHALTQGIRFAKGPVITIVDSDDRAFPCALTKVMPCFNDPAVGFVWSRFITSKNAPGWSGQVPEGLTLYNAMMSGWWRAAHHKFFRKSTYLQTPGLQPQFDRSVDFELVLLLASTGCKYRHIEDITYWYRQGRQGSITSEGASKQRNTVKEIKQWMESQRK